MARNRGGKFKSMPYNVHPQGSKSSSTDVSLDEGRRRPMYDMKRSVRVK